MGVPRSHGCICYLLVVQVTRACLVFLPPHESPTRQKDGYEISLIIWIYNDSLTTSGHFLPFPNPTPLIKWPLSPSQSHTRYVYALYLWTRQGLGGGREGGRIVAHISPVWSLYVLLPQYRPRCVLFIFVLSQFMHTYALTARNISEKNIVSYCNSELRNQNAQRKRGLSKNNCNYVFTAGVELMYFQSLFRMLWAMVGN